MKASELKEKYLKFFEKLGHARIRPSPLVLENDTTTLFTSSGMQQLAPYLKGKSHPQGKRLVDIQPSLRLQDIEEVGDSSHSTYFEMLGNWSLGDYFKAEQLPWIWEFFTKELHLTKEKLFVSVFEGSQEAPKDTESYEIWKKLGISEKHIYFYGVDKNWWSRSGTPAEMPTGEIGGPDSEIFYDFGENLNTHTDRGNPCHPNCQCGRFMEIGNSVFIQYEKQADGKLKDLPQKNVDFGGGLERITAAVNNHQDIFRIDIFQPLIDALQAETGMVYGEALENDANFRIIIDHLRAAVAINEEGILPGNKLQGYVLRRLIRRAALKMRKLPLKKNMAELAGKIVNSITNKPETEVAIKEEVNRFWEILNKSTLLIQRNPDIKPFDIYQTYGLPYEVVEEIMATLEKRLTAKDKEEFEKEFEKHKKLSRSQSAGMFKGGLAENSEETTKLHTATHLLHSALRKVLGEQVQQKGSNITAERLRFDFSNTEKLSETELLQVEKLVNEQIKKNLPVTAETKTLEEAHKEGALAFFGEKYGEKVKVYRIGEFSQEVCGGPHVRHTGEIGRVKIIKQEKVGAGIVRIYATNK